MATNFTPLHLPSIKTPNDSVIEKNFSLIGLSLSSINGDALALSNRVSSLTALQTITLTGDVTGSGTGSFATTIGANKVLNSMVLSLAWSKLTGTPTTLAGYGITDAQPLDADLTAIAALATTGVSRRSAANTWVLDDLSGTGTRLAGSTAAGALTNPSTFAGNYTFSGVITLSSQPVLSSLSASQAVFTDASKGLVSNPVTGTVNVVMSDSPTLTGTYMASKGVITSDFTIGNSALLAGSALTYSAGTGAMTFAPTSFALNTNAILQASNSAAEYDLMFQASRGTVASPSNVSNGDAPINIASKPYSGGTYFSTAQLLAVVDGTFTSGQRPPSRWEFYTNAANTSPALALSILSDQTLKASSLAGTGTRLTTSTSTGVQGNATTISGDYTFSGIVSVASQVNIGDANFHLITSHVIGTPDALSVGTTFSCPSIFATGSFAGVPTSTGNANLTLSADHYLVRCNNSVNITLTLPSASGASGREYVIASDFHASATVTIGTGVFVSSATGRQGSGSWVFPNATSNYIRIVSDGNEWIIFGYG